MHYSNCYKHDAYHNTFIIVIWKLRVNNYFRITQFKTDFGSIINFNLTKYILHYLPDDLVQLHKYPLLMSFQM